MEEEERASLSGFVVFFQDFVVVDDDNVDSTCHGYNGFGNICHGQGNA